MDIKVIYVNSDGLYNEHSQAADSIQMLSFKTANKELTDTKLGHLIDGADAANEHIHDARYYREDEFIAASAGAGDAGKPIKADAGGQIDESFINVPVLNALLDHGTLLGLADDDHTQYIRVDGTRAFTGTQSYTSHPTFTGDFQIVDKKYVDDIITGREFQDSVITRTITPPGSPVTGGRYLIDGTLGTPTGAFVGHTNAIATWNGSAYVYTVPTTGFQLSADDDTTGMYLYGGSSWAKKFYEVTTASNGVTKVGMDIQLDPLAAGPGLGYTSGVINVNVDASSIEINADTLRVKALGIKDTMIDFGTGAGQVSASDIPTLDAGNYFPTDNIEATLQFIGEALLENGVNYTAGTGGVTKGDLVYVSANNTVSKLSTITNNNYCIGVALTTAIAAATVKVLANDTVITGVLTGATAGTPYYWTGSTLTSTIPSTVNANVWLVGVAKNATDLQVEVKQIKKNG